MKRLSAYFLGASTIVGSVIGAGFITGREIATFFCFDLSIIGILICLITFIIFFYLIMNLRPDNVLNKVVSKVVAVANIVISACMLGGIKSFASMFLCQTEFIKILQIISLIIAVFICLNGMEVVGRVSEFLIPVALFVFLIILLFKSEFKSVEIQVLPKAHSGIIMPILYVGINVFLSLSVIKDACCEKDRKFTFVLSVLSSLILISFMTLIALTVSDNNLGGYDMPILEYLRSDLKVYVITGIICFIGIFSTLICSVYSAFTLASGKYSFLKKFILILLIYSLSKLGFASIVNNLYPIFGGVGVIFCIFTFLREIFQAKKPKRTLRRQVCIK